MRTDHQFSVGQSQCLITTPVQSSPSEMSQVQAQLPSLVEDIAGLGDLAEVDLDEVALLAPFPAAAAVAARGGVILAPPALVERDGPVLNTELRVLLQSSCYVARN